MATTTHDENGKFKKGNKASPGRGSKQREVRYSEILQSTCTFKEWGEICQKAVDQAKRGDSIARKWLSDNLMGLPVQRTELTGKDGSDLIPKVSDAEYNRAISSLASSATIREGVHNESTKPDGAMDAPE